MNSIWNTSLGIMARREHSVRELKDKLAKRFPEDESEIDKVILRLQDLGLQSDSRFAELWFRSQTSRGRGPVRIRGEARLKGIETQINLLLEDCDVDWYEKALELVQRKFPAGLTYQTKAKAYRFLSYRGFESNSIQYAINAIAE